MSFYKSKKKVPLPEPKVEPKKVVVLEPKEITKRLLRGSLCESCINRLISPSGHHCAVVAKEPTFKEQCTCPNYEANPHHGRRTISGPVSGMSGMTFTVSPNQTNGWSGKAGAMSATMAMTSSAFGWTIPPAPPIIPKTSAMHNMSELEKKVKEY